MRKNSFFVLIYFLLVPLFSFSQSQTDSTWEKNLSEVVVKATRANAKTAMAYTEMGKKEINKLNLGQDLPFLLNQMPSVVTTSDAGAGVGYTGIRIRGSDPTRINVTLNGIPYNDSESQGVYWVNMPDFASSVQSVQVQRGVGTSTNGAGAFGASINVNTLQLNREPFAEINTSFGSFNTFKNNIMSSTGLINNKFVLDARLSKIVSDGFVDRASSNLKSYYVSGGYYLKNSFIRLNVFGGQEKTYQSWNGIPEALAKNDKKGIDEFVSRNFYDETFKNEMLKSGRKFNFYTYENEVDDYTQNHIQLISSFKISKNWRFNPTLHYTAGKGFFEQYKNNEDFEDYMLSPIKIGDQSINSTDLIRRKWLDNNFYGAVWSLDYEGKNKIKGNIGGGWNKYDGDHFGEIIWAQYAGNSQIRDRYYDNVGQKTDFNIYGKLFYNLHSKWDAYLDLQLRSVDFSMKGTIDNLSTVNQNNKNTFFNPKLGLTYQAKPFSSLYLSYARGAKEPSRQDFIDNDPILPKPEKLDDLEAGWRFNKSRFQAETNLYFMNYKDQLVLTGEVNQTGDAIRVNVDRSYRAGLELQAAWSISSKWALAANTTLSRNKIKDFKYIVYSYDDSPNQTLDLKNADISFSPNVISGATLSYKPVQNIEMSLLSKYVGKQYLDNTSSETKKLDAFFVNDFRVAYTLVPKSFGEISLNLLINNILNHTYESNGYTYSYIYGGLITENFVFPQAGTNFLMGIKLKF